MSMERPAAGIAMTDDDLALMRLVSTATFIRGRTYAKTGSVLSSTWTSETEVEGDVEGQAIYFVSVSIARNRAGQLTSFTSSCTCPVGHNCKHGIALLLHALAGREQQRRGSAAWQKSLSGLLEPEPGGEYGEPDAPTIAVLLEPAEEPARGRRVQRRIAARPVVPGRRGAWVKGEVSWQALAAPWWTRNQPRHDRIELLRELVALDIHGLPTYYGGSPPLYLDALSARLWTLLDQARELGIPFVSGPRGVVPVVVDTERAALTIDVERVDGDLVLRPRIGIGDEACDLSSAVLLGQPAHGLAWSEHGGFRLTPLSEPLPVGLGGLLDRPELRIPSADEELFVADYLGPLAERTRLIVKDPVLELPEQLPPMLVLELTPGADTVLELAWSWRYSRGTVARTEPLWPVGAARSRRDGARETQVLEWLAPLIEPIGPLRVGTRMVPHAVLTGGAAMRFLADVLPALEASPDVVVELAGPADSLQQASEAPIVVVTADPAADSIDWLDLAVTVTVQGQDVPFQQLFIALASGASHLVLPSGLWFPLDLPELAELAALIEEARALSDGGRQRARISRYQVGLWDDLERLGLLRDQVASWRSAVHALARADELPELPAPDGLDAELRPYQLEGFRWLAHLHTHSLGGVLADEMGLGKTLQAIALMLHAQAEAPFLVIAPASVVGNWVSECHRFAPGLRVRSIGETGKRRGESIAALAKDTDVIVTSYTLFRLEYDEYAALPWAGLLLDEAQFAKNPGSRAYQCAKRLPVPFKLAMTGTPLENHLGELWSLLSIAAPGLFPNKDGFEQHYRTPIERGHDAEKLAQLRRRIAPLMLRRTKEEVAADLPEKQEQVLALPLHPRHRKVYDTFLQRERQKVLGLLNDMQSNRFEIFRSLTLLRQAALAPVLVGEEFADVGSTKLDAMMELVTEISSEGHRALVFSQFTRFLGMAAERLAAAGIAYCYLDGSTRNRPEVIAEFREGEAPVFLISLKAGGFGLNLTEADYCLLLDPWWNPATENQAVDRIHRIGQTKKVMVYRLVAEGPIEDKVMALKERKAALFDSVLGEGGVGSGKLSAADIRAILD
jgi:superfamily II DNA or RNA helicase